MAVEPDSELSIMCHPGTFSIFRLPACTTLDQFSFEKLTPPGDPTSFFSVTQTSEEFSIVCSEHSVFSKEQSLESGRNQLDGLKVESGWSLLQIKGQLEFEMIGVIARFSNFFADAEIPIFCISTFDTDYFLVKSSRLNDALRTLTQHKIQWKMKHA